MVRVVRVEGSGGLIATCGQPGELHYLPNAECSQSEEERRVCVYVCVCVCVCEYFLRVAV